MMFICEKNKEYKPFARPGSGMTSNIHLTYTPCLIMRMVQGILSSRSFLARRKMVFLNFATIVLACCCIALYPCPAQASSSLQGGYSAVVVKIKDGDTFEVQHGHATELIRLWGVDTPEWDQPFSRQAKNFLKKMLLNRQVDIEPLSLDIYGRTVARVYLFDVDIGQILVEKGYAWVHIYYCNRKICSHWKKLEREARRKKIGLWQQDKPVPPWQWKKRKKRAGKR
jgi:endonuclease YncB( thermonuclease family)